MHGSLAATAVVGGAAVVGVGVLVVVAAGAVVDEVLFGFFVGTEEPHPRGTGPATGIRALEASRLSVSMTPLRSLESTCRVFEVWSDAL
ncbi:MAG: hypothetical protein ACYDEY_14560 [Acidimicrobiales bacterium]